MEYSSKNDKPVITIGMPVYNGAKYIKETLDSLINQTFTNFELIVSDNASTDETEEICKIYAAKDTRIKYVRQLENVGPVANFKYVLMDARGDYFMWAAADDVRSLDYLELNYKFLQKNSTYVASGSPNGFENLGVDKKLVSFSIEEDKVFDRYIEFFNNCFRSHGLFYCLLRTSILRNSELLDEIFPEHDWLGFDWATILYLASKGKINRTATGYIIIGVHGVSSKKNIFKVFNSRKIEYFIPFYILSKFVMKLIKDLPSWQKLRIFFRLVWLNIFVHIKPLYRVKKIILYRVYCRFLKPLVKFCFPASSR